MSHKNLREIGMVSSSDSECVSLCLFHNRMSALVAS